MKIAYFAMLGSLTDHLAVSFIMVALNRSKKVIYIKYGFCNSKTIRALNKPYSD